MRRTAARIGIRESARPPILLGPAAIAVLVDAILLVTWYADLHGTPPVRFGPLGLRHFEQYFLTFPSRLLATVLLFSVLLAAGGVAWAFLRRGEADVPRNRILFLATAMLAAGLFAVTIQAFRPVELEAGVLPQAEKAADAGDDSALIVLMQHDLPGARASGRRRLHDPDPLMRFVYGAALLRTAGPDEETLRGIREAAREILSRPGPPKFRFVDRQRLGLGAGILSLSERHGIPLTGLMLRFEDLDGFRRWWDDWSQRLR